MAVPRPKVSCKDQWHLFVFGAKSYAGWATPANLNAPCQAPCQAPPPPPGNEADGGDGLSTMLRRCSATPELGARPNGVLGLQSFSRTSLGTGSVWYCNRYLWHSTTSGLHHSLPKPSVRAYVLRPFIRMSMTASHEQLQRNPHTIPQHIHIPFILSSFGCPGHSEEQA